jgi:hypothetical protein
MSATAIGAILGLIVGISLSVYVARLDAKKRAAGARSRPHYQFSLIGVPLILAGLGALLGAGIAAL